MSASKSKSKTTTGARGPRDLMVEQYIVIWVDHNINQNNEDCKNTLTKLRGIVNEVNQCISTDQCIEELQKNNGETTFVISSGAIGQHLVPKIHDQPKLNAIYIFCGDKARHQAWAQNWSKIKGVHTSIIPICEALKLAVKQCNQSNISFSIIGVNEGGSSEDLNRLEPNFMYTQIFKEILLEMEHDQKAINDLVTYCRGKYEDNSEELKIINEFQTKYKSSQAILWYTWECFTYKMINCALRKLDGDIIIRMGFFLCDVHRQIEALYKKQISSYQGKVFQAYRGQGMSKENFEEL
ncbi:unnamed protein product, partial [Rotaria socialis]